MSFPLDTVIVTGGAGFVGSHLIEALVADPATEVISVDNYSTGSKKNHIASANVVYLEGETQDLARLIAKRASVVFHLGEYARVERSHLEPDQVWKFNLAGTSGVLEYCRSTGTPIVYVGSSTRFSSEGAMLSPYAFAKKVCAELVRAYGHWYKLPLAIAYLFNVYGPREISDGDYATVIGKYIRQYLAGEPLTVTLPGTQLRNFTHVKDVVEGLLLVRQQLDGREYQLGNKKKYAIRDVAAMFPRAKIEWRPEAKGNRSDAPLDTRTAELIGWQATRELGDYIRASIAGHDTTARSLI